MKTLVLQQQSSVNNPVGLKTKFHYIIKDGKVIKGLNEMVHGRHTPGHNYNTIGVLIIDPKAVNKNNDEALKELIKDRVVVTFDKSLRKYCKKTK